MNREIYELFRRTLPYIVRDEETVLRILENKDNRIMEERNAEKQLIGVSVIHKNTILLLCVEKAYRNQGIGSRLLKQSEEAISQAGYEEVVVGVGEDYLMPGVPTSKRYAPAENECLQEGVDETASRFFEHRGYVHSWNCNCFDMKFSLCEFDKEEYSVGDVIDGIQYRLAVVEDLRSITECTDAACEEFTRWYQEEFLYTENDSSRVLVAVAKGKVVGTLMVDTEHESGLGSVGCTAVHPEYQGRHIAVNMVILGTKYLKDVGMREAYLSYTYSGLDHMYGYAGYKIFVYFMMAKKRLGERE